MATVNLNQILYEANAPLRFYDAMTKKNRFRFPNKNLDPYKLITPQHCFLPFTLITPASYQQGISRFELVADDGTITNLATNLLEWNSFLGRDYYLYKGEDHGLTLTCGFYYLIVTHNDGSRYFSEDFYVVQSGYGGANMAANGSFQLNLNGWVNQTHNIVWSLGRAYFPVTSGTKQLRQTPNYVGKIRVTLTVEGWAGSGTATVQIGGILSGNITGNGVYSFYGTSGGGITVDVTASAARSFYIDDVEIVPVTSQSMDCNMMCEWGTDGDCDFGNQFYHTGYFNRFIFPDNVELYDSKWVVSKQSTKNGNDDNIDQFKKRQKVYHIELVAPEYVSDALVEMSLHPKKTIVLKRGGRAEMFDVTVSAKPVLDSSLYQIEIDFSLDEIVESNCCSDIPRCLEPCVEAYDTAVPCVEGRTYIADDKSYGVCTGGSLVVTPCESGLLSNAIGDGITNAYYWLWDEDAAQWNPAPVMLDIAVVTGTMHLITALIIPFNSGQLQVSFNSGGTWQNLGGIHSSQEWLDGVQFDLLEGTMYLFRISNRSGVCDYQFSPSLSYTTDDTDVLENFWVAPNYYAIWRPQSFIGSAHIDFSITSLLCNLSEQLGSSVNFTVNASNATYSLGTDGQLHMTNLVDVINTHLPAGYQCFNDMQIIQYPSGESFTFVIHATITSGGFTNSYVYTYDDTTGFTIV